MVHVAAEMERRGFDDPAPDRRRHHQPHPHGGQDRPALRARPDRLCHRRQPRRRRRRPAALARRQGALRRRRPAPNTASSPTRTTAPRPTSSACRSPRPAPTPHRIDWAGYTAPKPAFLGTRVFETWDLAELARYIDWTPFFQTWELKGRYPKILEDEAQGAAARALFADAQAMLAKIIAESWFVPARRRRLLAGQRRRRRHRLYTDDTPHAGARRRLFTLRQQRAKRLGQPNVALADFVAARRHPRLCRRLRGHRRHRGAGDRRAVRARQRRLQRHPGQGPRRPLRRSLRRAPARAGAQRILGLCRRRDLRAGRPDRRTLSRHPPRARLSGPARPHRKGDAVPPARRRARHRRHPDRKLRDVARLLGLRPLPRPPRRATISAWPRSSATRSRTMPAARRCPSPRSSAGLHRSSTTNPHPASKPPNSRRCLFSRRHHAPAIAPLASQRITPRSRLACPCRPASSTSSRDSSSGTSGLSSG